MVRRSPGKGRSPPSLTLAHDAVEEQARVRKRTRRQSHRAPAEVALLHPVQIALGWHDLGLLCHGCRWKRRVAPVDAACKMEGLERRRPWKRLYCNILNPFNRLRFGFTNLVILPGYKILVILPLIRGRADEFRRNICHARTCSYIQIYFSFRINVHMWDETTGFLFAKRDISTTRGSYCSLLE